MNVFMEDKVFETGSILLILFFGEGGLDKGNVNK